MNNHVFFFFLSLLFTFIPNVKADGNHYSITQSEVVQENAREIAHLYAPIKFTRTGIRCFFKHAFNRPDYVIDFLPYNFTHLFQFLDYGNQTKQSAAYMQSIIRLFYNKVKATHYITSYALHELLEVVPHTIQNCTQDETVRIFDQTKDSINDLLYTTFLQQFSFFKQNPISFLNNLSENILEEIHGNLLDKQLSSEQFRQLIIRFLELCLDKVIWNHQDGEETWKSVKIFAQQIYKLHEINMLDEDELDDLYKTILERFCYYLHLYGSSMTLETVETIRKDIATQKLHFLELEEQEKYLETKKERLLRELFTTEVKIHASAHGIIGDY